jgi:hypothetical protein
MCHLFHLQYMADDDSSAEHLAYFLDVTSAYKVRVDL